MVSIAVKTLGVCDFPRLAVTDWRLWRWLVVFGAYDSYPNKGIFSDSKVPKRIENIWRTRFNKSLQETK